MGKNTSPKRARRCNYEEVKRQSWPEERNTPAGMGERTTVLADFINLLGERGEKIPQLSSRWRVAGLIVNCSSAAADAKP